MYVLPKSIRFRRDSEVSLAVAETSGWVFSWFFSASDAAQRRCDVAMMKKKIAKNMKTNFLPLCFMESSSLLLLENPKLEIGKSRHSGCLDYAVNGPERESFIAEKQDKVFIFVIDLCLIHILSVF